MKLNPGHLTLAQLRTIAEGAEPLELQDWSAVDASAALVAAAAAGDAPVYGVNTGFGKLASTRIAKDQLAALQLNLIRSHSVGVGASFEPTVLRLMLATKAASLARGYSGVRREVVQALLAAFNAGFVPYVPCQGSVGASGDLAPLSHMTLALMGEGEALVDGQRRPALPELQRLGLTPLTLAAKEGLALINGTQASTALALHALLRFDTLFATALAAGAMTLDAARGSDGPFDARIHAVRGQPGQIETAAVYRALLAGSEIRASHKNPRAHADAARRLPPEGVIQPWQSQMLDGDERVQDPYCLRCQPQVMGACLDQARHACAVLVREANAVTDNPLVFDDCMVSGGNFHAEPVALAADGLALAIAEVGAIAERRIAMLIDPAISRLPPFLTADAGLHSGFMIAHVTAAALASENKSLAHPASVDSLPTSANQEDHVSMATFAARRLHAMLDNTAHIVAIELLAAAQGIDFLRPLQSSSPIEALHARLRQDCASYPVDHYLAPDIERAAVLVHSGALRAPGAPPLQGGA